MNANHFSSYQERNPQIEERNSKFTPESSGAKLADEAYSRQVRSESIPPAQRNEADRKAADHLPKVQIVESERKKAETDQYEVKRGDSFFRIARVSLGKEASEADVALQAAEIARINGMTFKSVIHPGDKLVMPPHKTEEQGSHKRGKETPEAPGGQEPKEEGDKPGEPKEKESKQEAPEKKEKQEQPKLPNGEVITRGPDGRSLHTWPNGVMKLEMPDGSGKYFNPEEGCYRSWSKSKQSDNYEIQNYGHGAFRVNYSDQSGFSVSPSGELHHWGKNPTDNFEGQVGKDFSIKTTSKDGKLVQLGANGNLKTSSPEKYQPDLELSTEGNIKVTHKERGMIPDCNQKIGPDGEIIRELADGKDGKPGTKITLYKDGSYRRDNPDGTGHTVDSKGHLHTWGLKPEENRDYITPQQRMDDQREMFDIKKVEKQRVTELKPEHEKLLAVQARAKESAVMAAAQEARKRTSVTS